MIWTPDNSFLLEYRGRIESGEIIAGEEIWQELDNLAEDIKSGEYIYDTADALLRMDFMERCIRLTKSPFYGKPMILLLWQKAFTEALYSFKMPDTFTEDGKPIDRFKRALLMIARKNAKALALDTRIPTPDGDKTIAEINPGDLVYGADGKPTKVLATSEIFRNRKCYRFTFEDGDTVICDAEHKWSVHTKGIRRILDYTPKTGRKRFAKEKIAENMTVTLQAFEIARDFKRERRDGKGTEYKYRVPLPGPVEMPEKDLPLDPYVLGLWLGDGSSNDNRMSFGDFDIEPFCKTIKQKGIDVVSVKTFAGKKIEVRIGNRSEKNGRMRNSVRDALRDLGVFENKHIPEIYLNASIKQRKELLMGLMDTDGTISKSGQCGFTQKRKVIIDGFSRLLTSLGIKHTIRRFFAKCEGKQFEAYSVNFFADKTNPCFRLERKKARLKEHLAPRMAFKSIVNVEEVEPRDTKCIKVDREDGLFLCGSRNTVTHNSETCSALLNAEFIVGNEGADIVCSSNDDAQASIVYDSADMMRKLYDPEDLDTKRNQRFILNKETNTKIFKLSDRTRNKEGRNIDWAILDEIHELLTNNIPKAIEQSQSVKDNPKFIQITTEGFVLDGYLDEELRKARAIIRGEDDSAAGRRFLPWLYTQDSEAEIWQNPRSWQKSNPSLGIIKKVDYLQEQVDLARRSKTDRLFVLSKDFNLKQNGAQTWLNLEDYSYPATFDPEDLRGAFCVGHVDLAETTDLCCAKAMVYSPETRKKYILTKYFIPQSKLDPDNDDHNAGAKYSEWARAGYIQICDGNEIDLTLCAKWFYDLYKEHGIKLYKCGYDQKFARDWLNGMDAYGWTREAGDIEMIIQNSATLNNALNLVEADFRSQLINYNENPVDRWCFSNACLKVNDQRQALCVKMENAKKIDGAVTLISLYEVFRRYKSDLIKLNGGGNKNGAF